MEQRLKGGKEKDNFPYLNASRKPRNVGLVGPRLTNVGLVGLLAALLYMIVNWSEKKQGSGPKGDKVL